jgi:hypothetical protein
MLIGKKQDALSPLPGPLERGRGVRRGADDATAFADEGFDDAAELIYVTGMTDVTPILRDRSSTSSAARLGQSAISSRRRCRAGIPSPRDGSLGRRRLRQVHTAEMMNSRRMLPISPASLASRPV